MATPLIGLAHEIAKKAHAGQFRRNGNTPYLIHPMRVVDRLRHESEFVIAAAWLHDIIEDTPHTAHTLSEAGIPERIIRAILALTKHRAEDYDEYLSRVMADAIARKVKVADILDNLSDDPTPGQISRYARALNFLVNHVSATKPAIFPE